MIEYPSRMNPDLVSEDPFRSLYMVPRLVMGVIAVIDTFLVYRIGEIRYGKKAVFIAALAVFSDAPYLGS